MQIFKQIFFCVLVALTPVFWGCGGSDPVTPLPEAPRVMNLKANPDVICVGSASNITFELFDPNQDPITWELKLSSSIHGSLDKSTGTDSSGTQVTIRFKAATSGRHQHRITVTLSATDPGGLPAASVSIDLYVFNCG
jgi:hypothetical protein